jgi:hypothetical protein
LKEIEKIQSSSASHGVVIGDPWGLEGFASPLKEKRLLLALSFLAGFASDMDPTLAELSRHVSRSKLRRFFSGCGGRPFIRGYAHHAVDLGVDEGSLWR